MVVVCVYQDGTTALMIAAQEGHCECLSILLPHGAEVDKTNAVSAVGLAGDAEYFPPIFELAA